MMNGSYPETDYSSVGNISVYSSGLGSLSPYLNVDPSFLHQDGGAEFVFAEDSHKKRGWGERMFTSIGWSYGSGLLVGGIWGLAEGLRRPDGTTFKLRLNSVLNGCTRRGPFLGNSLAVVALLYGCTSTAIEKARGVEDEYNSIAAGVTTGVLFKSTGGPRAIAIAGTIGGAAALMFIASNRLWNNRGQTWSKSQPNWA